MINQIKSKNSNKVWYDQI